MAKTSAERQAAYRAKRTGQDSDERRLNTWVSVEAYSTIEKLAKRYGVTRRAVIELLVSREDGKLKELKAKGKLLPDKASSASVLRRNESKEVGRNKKGSTKQGANKLLRNAVPEVVKKKSPKQPAQLPETKPRHPFGSQFELEL